MRVHEGRRHQIALGIDGSRGAGRAEPADIGDLALGTGNVDAGAAVGQGGVGDQEIEHVRKTRCEVSGGSVPLAAAVSK